MLQLKQYQTIANRGGSVGSNTKKNKKGDLSLPTVNYFCIAMKKQLTEAQRYEIYLGLNRKWSLSHIAREIEVSKSTVSREIRRNAKTDGSYVWKQAQAKCESRKHGFKSNHRKPDELWWRVDRMIEEDWSPGQIAGVLRKEGVHICKQTIYNHVHADTTGKLARHMPHELRYRRRSKLSRATKVRNIPFRTSIHDRPPSEDVCHKWEWEMDTIVDGYGHAILTLVERSTNYVIMERLKEGRKALPTARAVVRLLFPFRDYVRHITTDNGTEFAAHLEITKGLSRKGGRKVVVYFADSYAAWQKGTIENANKLIRKYIPKSANFNDFSNARIKKIQYKLNNRPREKLNFETPKHCFFKNLT